MTTRILSSIRTIALFTVFAALAVAGPGSNVPYLTGPGNGGGYLHLTDGPGLGGG